MNHYYKQIQGWFTFPELYSLAVRNAADNSHFVEIGSWRGKSSVYMGVEIYNSQKKIRFDCVDTWLGCDEQREKGAQFYEPLLEIPDSIYREFLANITPLQDVINVIRKPSIEASRDYADNSLDFAFIDASHDYESVCADIKNWLPKIKHRGILAGHDIAHNPIKEALRDTLKDNFSFNLDEDVWIYRKIN